MGKVFTVLENNPQSVNTLAYSLGLSSKYAFHDVYSLTDPDLLSLIPRPAYALLAIIPLTETWNHFRSIEDAETGEYTKSGAEEPVIWFKQTIRHGCGSIGMLHCTLNDGPKDMVSPNSHLETIKKDALPLMMEDRAELLQQYDPLYEAHQAAARMGDTVAPSAEDGDRLGQHFVAFVKGKDRHLYELEGSRKGPLDRGDLGDQDLLSEKALELGLGRLIELEKTRQGDLRFSCVALAPNWTD